MNSKIKKILYFSVVALFFSVIFFVSSTGVAEANVADWLKESLAKGQMETFGNMLLKLPVCILAFGAWVAEFLLWIVFSIATMVVEDLFSPEYYSGTLEGFSTNPIVIKGWKVIAAICNIFYIIILLFIGVGTLLRIEKYNYKKLLIRLIVLALLTNFSLLFAGIILDFVHMIMFSGWFGNPIEEIRTIVKELFWGQFKGLPDTMINIFQTTSMEQTMGIAAGVIAGAIFVAASAIAVLAIGFFLVIRMVALWILLVLSPFAYIGMILPDTQPLAKKWWSNFLKYAFLGPLLFFFLWFSTLMMSEVLDNLKPTNPQNELTGDELKRDKNLGNSIEPIFVDHDTYMYFFFVTFLMWGSIIAAASLSITGAGMVTKFAQAAVLGGMVGIHKLGFRLTGLGLRKIGSRLQEKPDDDEASKIKMPLADRLRALPGKAWDKTKAGGRALKERETWGKGFTFVGEATKVGAALEPITLARGIYNRARKMIDKQQMEDEEAITQVAGLTWAFLRRKVPREAGIMEERNRDNSRAKIKGKIAILEEEKRSLTGKEANDKQKQIDDQKAMIARGGEFHESKDAEYIKAAKRAVYGKKWRAAVDYDRVQDEKVALAEDRLKGIKSRYEALEAMKVETNWAGIESLLFQVTSMGGKLEKRLRGEGIIAPDGKLENYIKENFKGDQEKRGELITSSLDNIARQKNDWTETNRVLVDPKTKKLRWSSEAERVQLIGEDIASTNPREFARTFQKELLFENLVDGRKRVADTAKVAIQNMDEGFMMNSERVTPEAIEQIQEFLDNKSELNKDKYGKTALSESEINKLDELVTTRRAIAARRRGRDRETGRE